MTEQEVTIINNQGAQGDVLFRRVSEVSSTAVKQETKKEIVVAHSETGHNHTIASDGEREHLPARLGC